MNRLARADRIGPARPCLTNCLTIATHAPAYTRTATDIVGRLTSGFDQTDGSPTLLRDEEVAGSNPVTPTRLGRPCPRRARTGSCRFLSSGGQAPRPPAGGASPPGPPRLCWGAPSVF